MRKSFLLTASVLKLKRDADADVEKDIIEP